MRSYDEYCAVAKSLDVIGDRWTLLIVRELVLKGPSRYTDLRQGLPGIATNLLAQRLRELEQADVIAREEAPPPIATTLFRLTDRGEQLRPLLEHLGRWGVPLMVDQRPTDEVRSYWLAWALEVMLADQRPDSPPVTIELRTGDQPIALRVGDGAIQTSLGAATDPALTLTGPERPILGMLIGMLDPARAGAVGVDTAGDIDVLDRVRSRGPAPAARR
jgi:DNA-binding HxlR family transcriptional regulator